MADAQDDTQKAPALDVVKFDVATATSQGSRNYQEDTLLTDFALGQRFGYAILADGMGGQAGGDVASAIVASEMFLHLKMNVNDVADGASTLPAILRDGAERANKRVARFGKKKDDIKGMGSTLVLPIFSGDQLHWISIGDSPLMLFRDGELRQLNKDHSMAPQIDMMVKTGTMDPEVAKNHPDRNILTSVLNGDKIEQIDCPEAPTALLPGDIVVVASDGLQFLSDEEIAETLTQNRRAPGSAIADALLSALIKLDHKDQDNIALAVIKVGDDAAQDAKQPSETAPKKKTGLIAYFSRAREDGSSDNDNRDGSEFYNYRGQKYKE